jgi:hypothetical protein
VQYMVGRSTTTGSTPDLGPDGLRRPHAVAVQPRMPLPSLPPLGGSS